MSLSGSTLRCPDQRYRARIALIVALTRTLGTNDADVVNLDAVHPKVGLSALDDGRSLVGDRNHRKQLRAAYDARTTETTHDERTQLFDELLGRIEKYA